MSKPKRQLRSERHALEVAKNDPSFWDRREAARAEAELEAAFDAEVDSEADCDKEES